MFSLQSHHSVAPKRTINESGTIVLSTGDEGGEPTPLMVENTLGEEQEESSPSKKRRVLSFRPKRFRSEWLVYDLSLIHICILIIMMVIPPTSLIRSILQ